VLSYEGGLQCSLRVGDGDIAAVLALDPIEQGRMTERSTNVGAVGFYVHDEATGNLRSLWHARTWFAFDPDAPPQRDTLTERRDAADALVGVFSSSHDPSGLRSDATEGSGFEHVDEPSESWHLTCFADGFVLLWEGVVSVAQSVAGRARRDGDRMVIRLTGAGTDALPEFEGASEFSVRDATPSLIPRDHSIAGSLEYGEKERVTLVWAGHRWS
jgi:hypothetical protein